MNNKGQIFSIDFLFGTILLVFAIGVLLSAGEINYYNQRELIKQQELNQKTITGALILANSIEWSCDFNEIHPAYSINTKKFEEINLEKIKTKTNLVNQKIRIKIGEKEYHNEIQENLAQTKIAYELEILSCTNQTDFNQLKQCIDGTTCEIEKKILLLEVSE